MSKEVLYQKQWEEIKEILEREQDVLRLAQKNSNFYTVEVKRIQEDTLKHIYQVLQIVKFSNQPARIDGLVMSIKLGLQKYQDELKEVEDEMGHRALIGNTFGMLKVAIQEEKPFLEVEADFRRRIIEALPAFFSSLTFRK
ncbi:MAG: hypothetical protein WC499_00585 [Patescibacteria group bacterium]